MDKIDNECDQYSIIMYNKQTHEQTNKQMKKQIDKQKTNDI